jgi:hypothetical protein
MHWPVLVNGTKDPLGRGKVSWLNPSRSRKRNETRREFFEVLSLPNAQANYFRAAGELSTSRARRLAAVRDSTPSFSNISRTCFFTVDSLLPRIVAISPLVLPWLSQRSVSFPRRAGSSQTVPAPVWQIRNWASSASPHSISLLSPGYLMWYGLLVSHPSATLALLAFMLVVGCSAKEEQATAARAQTGVQKHNTMGWGM